MSVGGREVVIGVDVGATRGLPADRAVPV